MEAAGAFNQLGCPVPGASSIQSGIPSMAPDCALIPPESVESSISSIETVPEFIPANLTRAVLQVLQVQKLCLSKLRGEIINKPSCIANEC